jgi:hypothetical protein
MIGRLIFAVVAGAGALFAEIPEKALDLYRAGAALGDRSKLWEAWELAPCPEIAAALADAWMFEIGPAVDEELVGTPLFLQVLSVWEEKEPENALVPCLRELFRSSRDSRLPNWDRLREEIGWKQRVFFHYRGSRTATLELLLARRGNSIETWLRWLGQTPLVNVGRVLQLLQSCLLEARFHLVTGEAERGTRLLGLASQLAGMVAAEDDEIALRKVSLEGGVLQERLFRDLLIEGGAGAKELIAAYRPLLAEERQLLSRLAVMSSLHAQFVEAYRRGYQRARPAAWDDLLAIDPGTMAAFARAAAGSGSRAVEQFWRYRDVPLDDFTSPLAEHLEVFSEADISREKAAAFIDYFRQTLDDEKGTPTWVIPAYLRVQQAFPDAKSLGTAKLPRRLAEEFRSVAGALAFLAADEGDEDRWIKAFRDGTARPYLLLAFAKRKLEKAVPAIVEELLALPPETPATALLDYALCLRALTGVDCGLNAQKWGRWFAGRQE